MTEPPSLAAEELVAGERCSVFVQDCCVTASFTARLVAVTRDPEGYVGAMSFDNGVELTDWSGVLFRRAEL